MADYNDINKAFNDALYGQRDGFGSAADPLTAFGTPPPLNDNSEVTATGRGGFFSLSAANNSMQLLSSSTYHTFEDDPVIGLLYNDVSTAGVTVTGAHVNTHHLADPVTGGGEEGVDKHAAATIKFSGQYFNGGFHGKHRKLALVTKKGNTIFYTINKHETSHGRHTFTPTGSAGSDFNLGHGVIGSFLQDPPAVGDNMRRLVHLGYR